MSFPSGSGRGKQTVGVIALLDPKAPPKGSELHPGLPQPPRSPPGCHQGEVDSSPSVAAVPFPLSSMSWRKQSMMVVQLASFHSPLGDPAQQKSLTGTSSRLLSFHHTQGSAARRHSNRSPVTTALPRPITGIDRSLSSMKTWRKEEEEEEDIVAMRSTLFLICRWWVVL